MTLERKIAQMIWIDVYPYKDSSHFEECEWLIRNFQPGGIIFMKGSPYRLAVLSNRFQALSNIPVLTGIDGEWGLSMRLDSTIYYPKQMTLGAITNPGLIYQMGQDIAIQCKRLNLNTNFSPVVDINNNPQNPVIGIRSFGEEVNDVIEKSGYYLKGLQDGGLIGTIKHFPGHGDTEVDSHLELPSLSHSHKRLDSVELIPFRALIDQQAQGVMVGHLNVPSLDSSYVPATLSKKIVTELLRDQFGFKGLVFTDALNMKGVTNFATSDTIAIESVRAGNNILLMPEDIPCVIEGLKNAVLNGYLDSAIIEISCKKILQKKFDMGLLKIKPVFIENLFSDLNSPTLVANQRKIYQNTLTLVKNTMNFIPIRSLDTLNLASLCIGSNQKGVFQTTLDKYCKTDHYFISSGYNQVDTLLRYLKSYNHLIVSIENTDIRANRNFGIHPDAIRLIKKISDSIHTGLCIFASPYSIRFFDTISSLKYIVLGYESKDIPKELSAEAVFGGIALQGSLPVTISKEMKKGNQITTQSIRNSYVVPEEIQIESRYLTRVEQLIDSALQMKAFPGCQVYASVHGQVFYHRAFGTLSYDMEAPVTINDRYDLASLTKILAVTPALIHLYDSRKMNPDKHLSKYDPRIAKSNVKKIDISDLLLHQSGLPAWIPFHQNPDFTRKLNYRSAPEDGYRVKVAQNQFVKNSLSDSIFETIINLKPGLKKYQYSDLGFILLGKTIEHMTGMSLDKFCDSIFYKPLGASSLCFNPVVNGSQMRIAPTELDTTFRRQLISGTVHDPTAALLGGVAGHAGLFGNANDVGKIMELFLNQGSYGGVEFFKPKSFEYFNTAHSLSNGNRRGYGFDKPQTNPSLPSPVGPSLSSRSFGHSGFTGVFTWADPETGLVFVFLSNRVHPSAANNKLTDMNLRTNLLELFQQAILANQKKQTSNK